MSQGTPGPPGLQGPLGPPGPRGYEVTEEATIQHDTTVEILYFMLKMDH